MASVRAPFDLAAGYGEGEATCIEGGLISMRHIGDKAMIDEPSASDLEKAYQILSEFGLLIGPAGKNSDAIARAIAAGIALGRKEASPDKSKKKR